MGAEETDVAGLRAELERLRSLLDVMPAAVHIRDAENRIVYANQTACRMLGLEPAEVIGQPLERIVPADVAAQWEQQSREVLSSGVPLESEETVATLDEPRHFLSQQFALPDADHRISAVGIVSTDITVRRREAEELRRRQEQLAAAEAVGQTGSWEWDLASGRISWSEGLHLIFGADPGATPSFDEYRAFIHPADRDRLDDAIDRALAEQSPMHVEHRIVRHNREVRWLACNAQVHVDERGQPVRMVGIARDVSAQRAEREALRLAEERFRGAFEHAPIGMAIQAVDGRFLRSNAHLCEILGRTDEGLMTMTLQDVVHPADREAEQRAHQALLNGASESWEGTLQLSRPAGPSVRARVARVLIRSSEGRPLHFVCLVEALEHGELAFADALPGTHVAMPDLPIVGSAMECTHCGAVWLSQMAQDLARTQGCLLCSGPLEEQA